MTEQLFMTDCYLKEFDANVVSSGEGYVVLDRSAFYPEGGGQPTDTGTLNGVHVTKVKKKEGEVRHYVETPVTGGVHGVLDWEHRYAYMRMHTAEHLLLAIALDRYNAEIIGNQIGAEKSRMDFTLEKMDAEMRECLTSEFNKIVGEGRSVRIYTTSRDSVLESVDAHRRQLYEKALPNVSEVRVVDIDGIDKSPCGGTHVANTSEIGQINIIKVENKGAGKRRLVFELK